MRNLVAALTALALLLLAACTGPQADVTVSETAVRITGTPESDGRPVTLDGSVFTTNPGVAQPTVVLAHGFGGSKASSAGIATELARDGYTVITYTARGFGSSGGLIHLDNPRYEGRDTERVVDFAATRPEVAKVGDDPVIGFAGASYGGAAALLAGTLDRRVDAIAPAFTWHSLTQALVPQSEIRTGSTTDAIGVFKQRWTSLLITGAGEQSADSCGRLAPTLCQAFLRTAESGAADQDLVRLLDRSGFDGRLDAVTAPTLLVQGEQDTLFPIDQAVTTYRELPAATPKAMRWVTGGHDGGIDLDDVLPDLTSWFDRYLRGDPGADVGPGFSVAVPETSLVRRNGLERPPQVYRAADYPSAADLPHTTMPLTGAAQSLANPAGGVPAALTSLPGSGSALAAVSSVAGYPLAVLPGQSATFTTAELVDPVRLTGSGEVRLDVTSAGTTATLFVSLWDLGPDLTSSTNEPGPAVVVPQTAVLPQQQVAPVHLTGLTPGQPRTVRVALAPAVAQVPVGHRLRVVVSSTDQAYATPRTPARYTVALAGDPVLTLPQPVLTTDAGSRVRVQVPLAVAVGLVALAAIAALLVRWRRRAALTSRPDLVDTPLVVDGLVKRYAEGVLAVDGVSFAAEPGQVVGLLGPNGAGKTTTLRMMVGLIRPDGGAIYVHGDPVHAGSDVLAGVGAFIEGPGFLPHLSGMDNLQAYWRATGRSDEDAHLDEALAIAGLGEAVHRRVRGYSQGMRQRLGIAQAMLGLPDLLLLDEPTNGLDPPQIKAMRTVLADYAATGRTVVVSSHLLTEVELTCSHVVVMNHGTVVLTGSVPELTSRDAATVIGLTPGSDLTAAAGLLTAAGLDASVDGEQLRVSGGERADVVASLVAAGYGVTSVEARRHLEDVFMSLVSA